MSLKYQNAPEKIAATQRFFARFKELFYLLKADLAQQTADPVWAHEYALQYLTDWMVQSFLELSATGAGYPQGIAEYPQGVPLPYSEAACKTLLDRVEQIRAFFKGYSYTLTEGLAPEIAIDPEMIGTVHECLASGSGRSDERGEAGIFYTPRTEINLMCRLALVDYLANHLGQRHKDALYDVVFARELREKISADAGLAAIELWQPLNDLLHNIRVIDPACGAGAFLLGMLYILDDLQERANRCLGLQETPFARRKRIISHSLYGVDVKEWSTHIARLRLWLALIKDVDISNRELADGETLLPGSVRFQVRRGDSLLEQLSEKGFDIVIGNPPYVRQEQISRLHQLSTVENKQAYKAELARSVYQSFPLFFGYNVTTNKAIRKIDAKSDLYIYFYFLGLSLLHPKGSLCFITSNSWLDVRYGAVLQEFLLKHCHVKMILDSQIKRSFNTADVNTVITLFSAPDSSPEWGLSRVARFVLFHMDFESAPFSDVFKEIERAEELATTSAYRAYPINQETLLEDGCLAVAEGANNSTSSSSNLTSYTGNKWGGKYLRAPHIYRIVLAKGKDLLIRLGDIAEIRRGFTTGANEFFYLDTGKARHWGIEEEFLQPVIKSPRECKSIVVDPEALKYKLFLCHLNKHELKGTAAMEYIRWGESQNYHMRPSCAGRVRWWDAGARRTPYLLFNYLIDTTAKTFYIPHGCYGSDNFQEVHPAIDAVLPLCASLNSTLFQLLVNVAGRSNFGDGLLKIQTYELSDLLCMNPQALAIKNSDLFSSSCWDVLSPSADRLAVDRLIFDALELTQGEQDAVYEAVQELVERRRGKARSIHGTR